MKPLLDFCLGLFVGATLVGSSTQRTISTYDGDAKVAAWSCLMNSLTYYISIRFVVKDDYVGYIGTAVGSLIVILYLSFKNKKVK